MMKKIDRESVSKAGQSKPLSKKNNRRKKKHLCNRRCPWVRVNARGEYRCGIFTDAFKIIEGAVRTRRVSAVHLALEGISKLTKACRREEHVTVRALSRCSGGTYDWGIWQSWYASNDVLMLAGVRDWVCITKEVLAEYTDYDVVLPRVPDQWAWPFRP
jgi:hypothetical protein